MTDLKLMLLIAYGSVFIAEWSGVPKYISHRYFNGHRIKPFDCGMCLTFWNTLTIFLYLQYGIASLLYAFANAGIAVSIFITHERIAKG